MCGVLIACDKKEDSLILENSNIEIKAKILKSSVNEKSVTSSELETVLTIDDIVSYNGTTGEIIFKGVTTTGKKVYEVFENFSSMYDKLEFYKDNEFLFKIEGIVTDASSAMYNVPILFYDNGYFEEEKRYKFFILDGYGGGLPISKYEQSPLEERIENVEKILHGWNIFIECLKKEGKYIE